MAANQNAVYEYKDHCLYIGIYDRCCAIDKWKQRRWLERLERLID